MALEARRHITLITTHTNQGNALYGLLIPIESNSSYKPIQKYYTLDHDNCIARGLHNGEFWSSGKRVLGGHGWGGVLCRIFPTKKISINSYLTVCKHYGIRAHHYTNMGHIWAVCTICCQIAARKKMKKNSNPPLRISAAYGIICGVSGKQGFPPVIQKRDGTWQSVISLIIGKTAGSVNWRAYDTR